MLSVIALVVALVALAISIVKRSPEPGPSRPDLHPTPDPMLPIEDIATQVFDRVLQMIPTSKEVAAQFNPVHLVDLMRDRRDALAFAALGTQPRGIGLAGAESLPADVPGIVGDLCYYALVGLPLSDDIKLRIKNLSTSIKLGATWSDPDRDLILGYLHSTPEGKYWNDYALVPFARSIGAGIKDPGIVQPPVTPPVPDPVVDPVPPAPSNGVDLASIIEELRASTWFASRLAGMVAEAVIAPVNTRFAEMWPNVTKYVVDEVARQVDSVTVEPGSFNLVGALQALGIYTDESGRIGFFGPPARDHRDNSPLLNYGVTIHGRGGAAIAFIGNEGMNDPQRGPDSQFPADGKDPQRKHLGLIGLSHDGGVGYGMGILYRTSPLPGMDPKDPAAWVYIVDEFRRMGNHRFDSQANHCLQVRTTRLRPDGNIETIPNPEKDAAGNRVISGQQLYIYPDGKDGEAGVHIIAGHEHLKLRGSTSKFYSGDVPADTGR